MGAQALDLVDESNMDINELEVLLENKADILPIIMITITNNTDSGNPVSIKNIKDVSNLTKKFNKSFLLIATDLQKTHILLRRVKGVS